MSKTRNYNYSTNHASYENIGAVTNHADGECSFKLDTIPEKGIRTVDVFQGDERLFSMSILYTIYVYLSSPNLNRVGHSRLVSAYRIRHVQP